MTCTPMPANFSGRPIRDRFPVMIDALRNDFRRIWGEFHVYLPAIVAVGFGVALLQPTDTFATSKTFDGMRKVCSLEWVWGAIFIIAGAAKLFAIYTDHPHRHVFAYVLAGLYVFIAASFALSVGFLATGTVAYGTIAVESYRGATRDRGPRRRDS